MTTNFALKYPLLAALMTLFLGGMLTAQQPELHGHWGFTGGAEWAPNWHAQWIWLPHEADADMCLARKTFTLTDVPELALLSITACSRYQLFVNGHYVGSGPARSAPHHQSFDVLNVTRLLRPGKNVLAIRAHHQREAVSYYAASQAGLLAQLDFTTGPDVSAILTDGSWLVQADESWLNCSPRMARFHLEVCDRVDLRRRVANWADLEVADRGWSRARVLRRESGWPLPSQDDRPTHLIPPWTSLVARDIPYLIESILVEHRPLQVGSIPAPEGSAALGGEEWASAPAAGKIPVSQRGGSLEREAGTDQEALAPILVAANPPGDCRVLVYDLGEVQNGRPFLDMAGPAGSVVDVMSAPYLLDESLQSPVVVSDYVDRIVLSGERERWEAFYMKPVRWLAVVFRRLPAEASLYAAGVVRSEYPFEPRGYFHTPDSPELERFWDAAAKTVRVCTTDAYTDNYRERRQYAQTAYYACLGNYPVFGDSALQRRYLKQIAEEQLASGIMPAYAPRHGDDFMVILDSNCLWIRGLHQYLLYSGDDATAGELLPAARKLLELLHSYTNVNGLIDSPPYPYWLDHAVNDRRGANFCLNAHYLGALEDFAQVLRWLNASDADIYHRRAALLRQMLREKLWDPQRQLFADALIDGRRSGQFSEHANAMALAMKIAAPEQMRAIASQLSIDDSHDFIRRASGIVMVTPAMSHMLHAGLCEAGFADRSWDLLQSRFSHMLAPQTNGTFWEEWWLAGSGRSGTFKPVASGRSDAQTESAFFPGLFARYILGIEPTQPGLREVVLRYYDSARLLRRRGAIPTPSGLLEVSWNVRPAEFAIGLQVPPLTTVRVDLASLGPAATDDIMTDGKPASSAQVKDGYLIIPSGGHRVRVTR